MTTTADRSALGPGPADAGPGAAAPDTALLEVRTATSAPPPVAATRPVPRQVPAWRRGAGLSLCLLALGLVGLLTYLWVGAGLAETRTQENLFKTFRGRLAAAVAPVGPVAAGQPVAIVSVPRLGLRAVVVEGTASGQLLDGPGHRADTPLPGQPGASVLLGRRSLAGAPFAHLDRLRVGDTVVVTTGQASGITYRVTGLRDSRSPVTAPVAGAAPTLSLVTADPPLRPTHSLIVTASLTSPVQPSGGARPALAPSGKSLAGDGGGLLPAVLWAQLLVLLAVATTWSYARWRRLPTWLVSTPVLLAVLWNVYENVARLLPNVL